MSWIQKYIPTTVDKIIGNKNSINDLFKYTDQETCPPLLVYGESNLGKSNSVKLVLKNKNFNTITIDLIKNKKNFFEIVTNSLFNKRIDFYCSKPKRTAYVIDNMENIKQEGDITRIIQIILKKKLLKHDIIVCITNNLETIEKFKGFDKIEFSSLCEQDTKKLILRVKNKENLKIGTREINFIIKNNENTFNSIVNTMQKMTLMIGNTITMSSIIEFYKKSINKDTIAKKIRHKTLNEIFSKNITPLQCIKKFNKDKSMIPMLVNDNYFVFFEKSNQTLQYKLDFLTKCSTFIMLGDVCDKLIYNQNNWSDQYIHCLFSCYFPSMCINKLNYVKEEIPELNISKTLGKYSRYRSNIKNVQTVLEIVNVKKIYNIHDIQYLSNKILFNLYDTKGNMDNGVSLLLNYNMDCNHIDKLQKIDVLNKCKYKVKNKNKIKKKFTDKKLA